MATVIDPAPANALPRQHVLVAAEGGLGLRPLTRYALKFASANTVLHLAAITGDPRSLFPWMTLRAEEWMNAHQAVLTSSKTALDNAQRHLAGTAQELSTSVLDLSEQTQSPAQAVASLAIHLRASLIAVTAFGRGERGRSLWRIDPEELASVAACPVLYVPYTCLEEGRTRHNKVMVALDGSDTAFDALSFVMSHMPAETQVHAVHVVDHALGLRNPPRITSLMKEGMRTLKRASELLKQQGRSGDTTLIGTSASAHTVSESIAHEAERCHADLVVLGSRGRSPLTRWLLGSVAERSLRAAKQPVLIVPPYDDRVAVREISDELAEDREAGLESAAVLPPIFL